MTDPFKSYDCTCDNNFSSDSHYLFQYDCQKELDAEKDSADILSLYKQMKLQKQLAITPGLDPELRKDLMYTNERFIGDIGAKIQQNNVNYSKTYQNLTNDMNTNTILWAIQNKAIHLNMNPNEGGEGDNVWQQAPANLNLFN